MKEYIVEIQDDDIFDSSRANVLEATIMDIVSRYYAKKDILGVGASQKDLDNIIYRIDKSPVFRRLVEQVVREYMRNENLN